MGGCRCIAAKIADGRSSIESDMRSAFALPMFGRREQCLTSPTLFRVGDVTTTIRVHCAELTIFLLRIAASSTIMKAKKPTIKKVQAIRCPTCGAGPGEKCELGTGQPRTEPHRDRRLIAARIECFLEHTAACTRKRAPSSHPASQPLK